MTALTDSRGVEAAYGYDGLNRLISAARAGTLPGTLTASESYSYDAVGNRVDSHLSAMHDHDEANRLYEDDLYEYDYDSNGNRRARVNKVTGIVEEYEHSVMNRLTGYVRRDGAVVERQARYFRDAFGRRTGKAVDMDGEASGSAVLNLYLYDGEDMAAEALCGYSGSLEVDAAVGSVSGCELSAVWLHGVGTDEPVVMIRDMDSDGEFEAGEALVYHTDHLGSVLAMTDMSGRIRARVVYDSYGNVQGVVDGEGALLADKVLSGGVVISESANAIVISGNTYLYTGREWDAELGMYYYRARTYDAVTGRFLQEDPVWASNLYAYVGNNPVGYRDPFGEAYCYNLLDPSCSDAYGEGASSYSKETYKKSKKFAREAAQAAPKSFAEGVVDTLKGLWDTIWYIGDTKDKLVDLIGNKSLIQETLFNPSGEFVSKVTSGSGEDFGEAIGGAAGSAMPGLIFGGAAKAALCRMASRASSESIVRVFRVEGDPNVRIFIDSSGNVDISDTERMLYLNFGDEAHAQYFYNKRVSQGMPNPKIKSFDVQKEFLEEIRSLAVSQRMSKSHPNSPQVSDPTLSPDLYGLRNDHIEKLKKKIVPGSGKTTP